MTRDALHPSKRQHMYVGISDLSEQILCSISAMDRRINSDTQVLPDYLEKISETPDLKTA